MKVIGPKSVSSILGVLIQATWYIQLLLFSIAGIAILISFFVKETIANDIPVTLRSYQTISGLQANNSLFQDATLQLNTGYLHVAQKADWQLLVLAFFFYACFAAISLAITYLLKKIFATLLSQDPFVQENALSLRKIALLIMFLSPLKLARDLYNYWFLTKNFSLADDAFDMDIVIDIQSLLIGLLLLIVAEIFRIGTVIKQENELTV